MGRWWCGALLAMVTGCGLFREPVPVITDVAAQEGLPESDLSHPKTLAWTRRFCAKMATQPATALGLVPSRLILPRLEAILLEHGLPRELVAVPAIESRYEPTARGDHGELGLWQLRPATARRFGLEVNARRDQRMHVDHSTRAAARYLAFLHARYGDWPLALAAYNAGEGRVDRALARRPGATFWELAERGALPPISREYVPKILAVVRLTSTPGSCRSTLGVQLAQR
jgi:membrane-bound lytic murein transglycosylase D